VAAAERRRIRRLSGNGAREGKGRILDETFLEKRFRISPVRSDKTVPGELSSPSVCSAFSAVAARSASAPALVCHDTQITYADLDHVSSRIGTQLRHAGVRRGQVVGLIAHRSIETVAAILGILKAGGAYLPLDISYPPDLLRHICRDSGLTLTLIEHALYRNAKISNIWSGTTYYISLSEGLIGPSMTARDWGARAQGKTRPASN
jgi:non-ribosomal peptide synthetase component F